jgi:hypothetical protein
MTQKTKLKKATSKIHSKKKNIISNDIKDELINIVYNTLDSKIIVYSLRDLFLTNVNNEKFIKYKNDLIPFSKNIQGKSGAVVGYLKDMPNSVIKIHYFKKNISNLIYQNKNCVVFNANYNEIFINILLHNIKDLPNFSSSEIIAVKKHLLEIEDYGIGNNGSYIITPLVGMTYETDNKLYHMNTFYDIIKLNHTPFLKQLLDEQNNELLNLYDEFLSIKLNELFNVFRILQKNMNYINSDSKLNNIFIKFTKNKNIKFEKLKQYGFVIDFILLLSDLDKSLIHINDNKFLTAYDKFVPYFIAVLFGYKITRNIRHTCKLKINDICPNIIINDFDILCIIIDLYRNLLKINLNILNYIPKTHDLHKTYLSITELNFKKLLNHLQNTKYRYRTSLQLSKDVNKICY